MIYKGIARGKVIELEEPLPYPEGQSVSVWVDISSGQLHSGSPAALRQVMHEPPHLRCEDVDELERVIEEGKLPMRQEGVFDKASWEETQAILVDRKLMKDLEEAEEDWNNGENYVDWEEVKEEI